MASPVGVARFSLSEKLGAESNTFVFSAYNRACKAVVVAFAPRVSIIRANGAHCSSPSLLLATQSDDSPCNHRRPVDRISQLMKKMDEDQLKKLDALTSKYANGGSPTAFVNSAAQVVGQV